MKTSLTLLIISLVCLSPLSALKTPGISVLSKNKASKCTYVGAEPEDNTSHISKAEVDKK